MVDISFVIPFIHEYPGIYSTINNIQTEMFDSSYDWEIIAVENGVVDENTKRAFTGPKALYRDIMGELVRYKFEPRQCGPIARNTGARMARGKYVIFMDAHTTLAKDSIDVLAEFLEEHPECGGISGLTSWSYYDPDRMGSYYELFHPTEKQEALKGGPTLPTHMHGHYMPSGWIGHRNPVVAVMGSQAYTMYRRREFLNVDGYFDGCRFYPHPEGYMPLKIWMCGQEMWIHQDSWHIHGMFHRHYEKHNATNDLGKIKHIIESLEPEALEEIKKVLSNEDTDEGHKKREEYGGHSWHWHGMRNVLMIAYILGDEKWLDICYKYLSKKHGEHDDIRESAIEVVDTMGTRKRLRGNQEMTLDEVLTYARKQRILGMENWFEPIGEDPL